MIAIMKLIQLDEIFEGKEIVNMVAFTKRT